MEEPPATRRRSESGSRDGEGALVVAADNKVLDLGHLLDEILLRLDIPAFLILASAVNRLWNTRARVPAFLVAFRSRLVSRPYPRPLGFYAGFLSLDPHDRTLFVPMLQQSPELTDVIDRTSFGCAAAAEGAAAEDEDNADEDEDEDEDDADEDEDEDEDDADEDEDENEDGADEDEDEHDADEDKDDADEDVDEDEDEEEEDDKDNADADNHADTVPGKASHILDCRNGRLLLNLKRRDHGPNAEFGVFRPLDEQPRVALLPLLPHRESFVNDMVLRFLPDAGGECVVISLSFVSNTARFCVLQDGAWSDTVCTGTGPFPQIKFCEEKVFVRNNLYVLAADGYIVRFEFSPEAEAVSSSVIQLPVGVKLATEEMPGDKPVALSRGHDSGVYFFHIKDSRLTAWLYSINAGAWLMDASISLPEAFRPVEDQIVGPEDFYDDLRLFGAGDNADFVFLADAAGEDSHIYYLNLRTKTVEVVYDRADGDGAVLDISAFMMV